METEEIVRGQLHQAERDEERHTDFQRLERGDICSTADIAWGLEQALNASQKDANVGP